MLLPRHVCRFISNGHISKEAPQYTPGPGNYKTYTILKQQHESKIRTSSSWGFGTAVRFTPHKGGATPGPGAYTP